MAGANFDHVRYMYEFDRRLKLLVLDGLERVEVSMRFQLGHVLGEGHPYAHCDMHSLSAAFTEVVDPEDPLARSQWLASEHAKWMAKVRSLEKNSKEEFVKHFKTKYGGRLPVWVVTEILDFGGMSYLYSGLKPNHRNQIAERFGFADAAGGNGKALAGWIANLNYIRNTCAHHARLWNKNMAVQGKELTAIEELRHAENSKNRVYASLAVMAYLLLISNPDSHWRRDLLDFIDEHSSRVDLTKMGFPENWRQESIWDLKYIQAVDPETAERRRLRQSFECVRTSDVGQIIAPEMPPKDAATEVRRRRSRSQLMALQLEEGGAYDFPLFQLDVVRNEIRPLVAYANARIDAKSNPWIAASWWLSPAEKLLGDTPLEALEAGSLTEEVVDEILTQQSIRDFASSERA
ncbi:abortive infection bacteriophage resistance protein [Paenarthrobacter nicotinovorans]|nr:abortive infection bacteriophage resistance protein [Paenarthrobacter nicotinovorans]